nr:hypothetical protein LBNOUPBR_LBNOUPBR_CDS_0010 [Gokushovirinae sp.]
MVLTKKCQNIFQCFTATYVNKWQFLVEHEAVAASYK